MWCDNFDGDLLKLVPEAKEVLAPVADVTLYTYGRVGEDGRLSHPAAWNWDDPLMIAFFGFDKDEEFKPESFRVGEGYQIVECTFEEAVRDCWAHDYAITIDRRVVFDMARPIMRNTMLELLYHTRGIYELLDEQDERAKREMVARELRDAVRNLLAMKLTWFEESPDAGPGCPCSWCGEAILEGPVLRLWHPPESPDSMELRFHRECYGRLRPVLSGDVLHAMEEEE